MANFYSNETRIVENASLCRKKNLFSLQGSQMMKTGFSLLEILHRENPVFITGMGLQCTFNWCRCTYHLSNLILLVRKFLHIDNYLYNNSLTPSLPKTRHFDTTWNFEVSHFDSTFVCYSYIPSSKLCKRHNKRHYDKAEEIIRIIWVSDA